MMFTIFGSGFGLYGYLPAIIEGLKADVCLPEKYRVTINSRPDLEKFESEIMWVDTEDRAIKYSDKIVISVKPKGQASIVHRCLELGFSGHFYLEKPLSNSPAESEALLELLDIHSVDYSVGYSFLYLDTIQEIFKNCSPKKVIKIEWHFMAHHFANRLKNWKRHEIEGGGVLRFYGIHIVALLANHGYFGVVNSKLTGKKLGEPSLWEASLSHQDSTKCNIVVNSRSEKQFFRIKVDSEVILSVDDPFYVNGLTKVGEDRRFLSLVRFLKDSSDLASNKKLYRLINKVWASIERNSIFSLSEKNK
jgi:hypothetical protein